MAAHWHDLAAQQAELIASHLRGVLTSGLGLLRSEFGVELGLRPDLYPSWVFLAAALVGLVLVLLLTWALACGGRKQLVPDREDGVSCLQAPMTKAVKPEEPKKKSKKKSADKKAQQNGRPLPEAQEEVKVSEEIPKPSPEIKNEKAKKNKKKPKAEVKPAQSSSASGKDPDEGNWETKVSNREKREKRKKDKGPDGSGSPGGVDPPGHQEATPAPAPVKVKKAKEPQRARAGKGDSIPAKASSGRSEEPALLNNGGWTDVPVKTAAHVSVADGEKWPAMPKGPRHRSAEPQSWGQETDGLWSGMNGRMKSEHNPVAYSVLGLNPTGEAVSHHVPDTQWDSHPAVDQDWAGINGISGSDPSSDWNAPTELWGNYEEPQAEKPAPPPEKPVPQALKLLDEDRDKGDEGSEAKSKKKKKKKKVAEEGQAVVEPPVAQVQTTVVKTKAAKAPEEPPPVGHAGKQSASPLSSTKKVEQNWEAPKQAQKKKARRET